jgi:hypothetical protein
MRPNTGNFDNELSYSGIRERFPFKSGENVSHSFHETTSIPSSDGTAPAPNLSTLVVTLLKGVLYQDADGARWNHLIQLQSTVRDYVSVLGLDLVLDEAEGYAFLRSRPVDDMANGDNPQAGPTKPPPRLIPRRQLSFHVSLLLALLRKKLAEFDVHGGGTRLILSRDEIIELIRVFLPESSNEARLVDQMDAQINKIIELGFLRPLKSDGKTQRHFEVRRILKAFVDAQWLADFNHKLELYRGHLTDSPREASRGMDADE